jgi:L-ascorbate metabolism protein UlaG (beta-lactamase superfamily)
VRPQTGFCALAAALVVAGPVTAADPAGCPAPATPGPAAPDAAGRPLTITFFGVSTLAFDDGQSQLLVDGYFSRPGFLRTALLPIGPDKGRVKHGLDAAKVTRLEALLTAHAHHDHALDTARIAWERPETTVVGDAAVAALAISRGTPAARVCTPRAETAYDFGPYRVTAYPTPHGPTMPVLHWLLDRPLRRPFRGAAWFGFYRDDENLSFRVEHGGRSILVHPSAGVRDYPGLKADLVFLGLGGLGLQTNEEIERYWTRTVVETEADRVVPIHWDSFFRGPDRPLKAPPRPFDDVDNALREVRRLAGDKVELQMLHAYGQVVLPPAAEDSGPAR